MSKVVIAMTHCALRAKCFTSYTIDSVISEGLLYPIHVQAEPDSPRFRGMSYCSVVENATRLGCYKNFLECIKNTLAFYFWDTEGYVLFVEDDIRLQKGAGDAFREMLLRCESIKQRMGFFSLYASSVNANKQTKGWSHACISQYGWCGNLALCIPTEVCRRLLSAPHLTQPDLMTRALDHDLGHAIKDDLNLDIWCHNPNLVDHLGSEHSSLVTPTDPIWNHQVRQPYDSSTNNDRVQYPSIGRYG